MSILKLILLGLETGSANHGRGLAAVHVPMAKEGRIAMSEKLVIDVQIGDYCPCLPLVNWRERITLQFFRNARGCERIDRKYRNFPALQVGFVTLRATGIPLRDPVKDSWLHDGVRRSIMEAQRSGMFGMWDRGTATNLLTFIQARTQELVLRGGQSDREGQKADTIYHWLRPVPSIWCIQAGNKNKIKILKNNPDDPIATEDSDSDVKKPGKRPDANRSWTSTNSASASKKRSAEGSLSGKEHEKRAKTKRAEDENEGTNTNEGGFFDGVSSA
jgi:hypothetical protein